MPPEQNKNTQDPHKGGSITDMAATGTSVPNDAGRQNIIPSVPRPDQVTENPQFHNQGLAEPNTAFAADNDTTLPQSTRDKGQTGEPITGTGHTMGAQAESKRI